MRTRGFIVATISSLALAGCGGNSEPPAAKPAVSSSTGTDESPAGLSNDDAENSLLAVADMPAGYAKDGKDGDGVPTSYICDYKPTVEQVAGADRTFNRDDLEVVQTAIRVYEDEAAARESLTQLKSELDKDCTGGKTADGEKYTVGAMSVPTLGDSTVGMRVDLDSGAALAYLYVQRGPVMMAVAGGGYSPMGVDDLQPLAEKQLAKVDLALARK